MSKSLRFSQPVLLIQSDDWGRVGVRDREGWEQLLAAGIRLGDEPYDFFSLETAEDISALHELLTRHHDSVMRFPSITMNFVTANLDLKRMRDSGFREIHLLPLADGLPGGWQRPGLLAAYQSGIADRVFYPALHGTTHFCRPVVEAELARGGERADLLRVFWNAGTPYIYSRMPWIGFEFWNPLAPPRQRMLPSRQQFDSVDQGTAQFVQMFGAHAFSACAPGYRSNEHTYEAWAHHGIKVVQNGPGTTKEPQFGHAGLLNIYRNIDFEPATDPHFSVEGCLRAVSRCFERGIPAVVSMHAINLHSTLKDFRNHTLRLLDNFLTRLEAAYPNLLYINDLEVYELMTREAGRGGASLHAGTTGAELAAPASLRTV